MAEEWRSVVGYEGLYEVSDLGRVRSLPRARTPGVILTPTINHAGYYRYTLFLNGRRKKHSAMALVLTAFVGPRPPGHDACHRNGDRSNNTLGNLRWGTKSSNQLDRLEHGTDCRGEKHYKSSLTDRQIRVLRGLRRIGVGPAMLGRLFNITTAAAGNIAAGRTRVSAGGPIHKAELT